MRPIQSPTLRFLALVAVVALVGGCASTQPTVASPSPTARTAPTAPSMRTAPSSVVPSILTCGDVFANTGQASVNGTTFTSCEVSKPGAQLRSVTATYAVNGDPKKVEAELIKRFGMTPLVFRCCGWEPKDTMAAYYMTGDGYYVAISMASGETVEHDWSKIAFTVSAQLYLESP